MKRRNPKAYQQKGRSLERLRRVAEVIWSHRGEQTILEADFISIGAEFEYCPVHLRVNSVEAESVIRMLEEAKLIFPSKHPNADRTCYLVNELKEKEWEAFLDGLRPFHRYFVQPLKSAFGTTWKIVVWLVSLAVAASVGAIFSTWIKKFL